MSTAVASPATIVPMRWWDVGDVTALEQRVFAGGPPWSLAQLWAELAGVPHTRHYLVARADGVLVGYAGMAVGPDGADVMTLAVHPESRRRGIGAALLTELLAEAEHRGAPEVMLEAREDNVAALALYADHGFERLSRRRGYYPGGVDGVVLRRRARGQGAHATV